MKKVLVFLLSLVFLMGFVACDNGKRCEHDFQGKCEEHEVCIKCGLERGYKKVIPTRGIVKILEYAWIAVKSITIK